MESRNKKIKSDAIYKEKLRQRIIQLKGTLNSLKLELIRETDLLHKEKEELKQMEEADETDDELANRGMCSFTHDDLPSDEYGDFARLTKLEQMRRQQYELRARNFQKKLSEVEVQCDVEFSRVQDSYKPLMQLSSDWSALDDLIASKSEQKIALEKQRSVNQVKSKWECLVEMMKRRQSLETSDDAQLRSLGVEPFPKTSYTSFGESDSSQESLFTGNGNTRAICGPEDRAYDQQTAAENFWYNRYMSDKVGNHWNPPPKTNDFVQQLKKDYYGANNDSVEQAISFAYGKKY